MSCGTVHTRSPQHAFHRQQHFLLAQRSAMNTLSRAPPLRIHHHPLNKRPRELASRRFLLLIIPPLWLWSFSSFFLNLFSDDTILRSRPIGIFSRRIWGSNLSLPPSLGQSRPSLEPAAMRIFLLQREFRSKSLWTMALQERRVWFIYLGAYTHNSTYVYGGSFCECSDALSRLEFVAFGRP